MLIIGAKGFAKEVLEVLIKNDNQEICFFDDVNKDCPDLLFGKYRVLKSLDEAVIYFLSINKNYTIGIGNPILRKKMFTKFTAIGGIFKSVISDMATIGSLEVSIDVGTVILPGAVLSNSVTLGKGCMLYYNVIVTHDTVIGDFVEISPAAVLLGRCKIGSFTHIGSNVTILPDVVIGENVIIGAGAVVTKNVPDNSLVYGTPAKIMKTLPSLNFI